MVTEDPHQPEVNGRTEGTSHRKKRLASRFRWLTGMASGWKFLIRFLDHSYINLSIIIAKRPQPEQSVPARVYSPKSSIYYLRVWSAIKPSSDWKWGLKYLSRNSFIFLLQILVKGSLSLCRRLSQSGCCLIYLNIPGRVRRCSSCYFFGIVRSGSIPMRMATYEPFWTVNKKMLQQRSGQAEVIWSSWDPGTAA